MDYTELVFTVLTNETHIQDVLIQQLADIGFESFEETALGFKAYIEQCLFDEDKLKDLLADYSIYTINYIQKTIQGINWNQEWENNFQPVTIGTDLYIRASFHKPAPEFTYELVIEPKMAFGTGHHETTSLMAEYLIELDIQGKKVLDMGSGSGILAILAEKRGASYVLAVDIDENCSLSTRENARINNCEKVFVQTGDIDSLGLQQFDFILANINRSVLLSHLPRYASLLATEGTIVLSGFYAKPDLEMINSKAMELGFRFMYHKERNKWAAAKFYK